ncbi:MAG: MFS transporter [Burkholderiales bacterium]
MKPRLLPADLVVVLAGITAAMHVGKLPPAIPVLRDALGITLLQAGFLLSLVQFAGMVAGIFIGAAADGIGLKRSVVAGLAILTVASAAGGAAHDAGQLMALRAFEGLGFFLAVLPVPSLLRELVPPERLNLRLGLWGTFMPTGTALALLCGPWVMAAVGWPGWWWTLAALTAAMSVWTALAVPPDRARRHTTAADAEGGTFHLDAGWTQRLRATLSAAGPWLVALTFAMYASQWLSVIGFLPSIYAQSGLSVAAAGALTALVAAVNALGNVGSGRLLHAGMPPERVLYVGFATMLVCAVAAFGLPATTPFLLRYAAVLVLSAVGGLVPGALFALAVRFAPGPRTVSTTVGWMLQFSALGQFVGPPIVAWVAGTTGTWQWTWTVTGTASVAGIVFAAMIGRVHRR